MKGLGGARLVAAREITEAFRRKSFWAIVGILFLGSTAAMVVPAVVGSGGSTTYTVSVVGRTPTFDQQLTAALGAIDARVKVHDAPDAATVRQVVHDRKADVGVIFGDQPTIVVRAGQHQQLVAATQQALAIGALSSRLEQAGLGPGDVARALASPGATIERVDPGRSGRVAGAFAISLVLYLLLLTLMMQVANGTAIEKANRISEVLLAIVRPGALLFGKVLGVTATGVVALLGGLVPVIVKLGLGGSLPNGLGGAVAVGAFWFLLGLTLYLTLAGALGALVERQEEAGSAVSPLMAVLIGTFIVLQTGPDSPVAAVLAYFPLSSPLVLPARLAAGVASPAEIVGSLVTGLLAVALAFRFATVVYGRAIVRTGRRLKLGEVLRPAR
ncbi:MAG TPA: ABC transporter permease [Acidimicrobiales bacterium]|nr:ABC transporter permease [Acidimicrobiales bacterium]